MLILNTGLPRSGTTLVNAIIRAVLKTAGTTWEQVNLARAKVTRTPLPDFLEERLRRGDSHYRHYIAHLHAFDEGSLPVLRDIDQLYVFANIRDPRDACVSYMRLFKRKFDAVLKEIEISLKFHEALRHVLSPTAITYELLVKETRAHIHFIAQALGIEVSLKDIDRIEAETSIESHTQVMRRMRKVRDEMPPESRPLRAVDAESLITDLHIQSGKHGRWQQELSPDQQEQANEVFAPYLERHGYR